MAGLPAQLDSRYVALTLPRILMRRPYDLNGAAAIPFCFREDVEAPGGANYLWGNAAYAFATVVIRAYATSGWFADIRGVHRGVESGGSFLIFRLTFSARILGESPSG